MVATEAIAEARRRIEAGDDKEASRLLRNAVFATADAGLLKEIRELAVEGSQRSTVGGFRKGMRWNGVIQDAETRLDAATRAATDGTG